MNKLNQFPHLLKRVELQWSTIHPHLPVYDASLLGCLIGVSTNLDQIGVNALKEFDIGQTEHDVLACARRQGEPYFVKPGLLLEEVRITSGALTTCINRLIEKKLLNRVASDGDKRSKPVQLTAKGRDLIDRITESRFKLAQKILTPFSQQEKDTLKALLLKLQNQL